MHVINQALVVVCAIFLSCRVLAEMPKDWESPNTEEKTVVGGAVNRPIDLLTPRIKTDERRRGGFSFWYENQARRNCLIEDVTLDGKRVTFSSASGVFEAKWDSIPPDARRFFEASYAKALKDKEAQVQYCQDRENGITWIAGATVMSIHEDGVLMFSDGKAFWLVDHPKKSSLADGDTLPILRVQTQANTYTYTTVQGAKATVRVLKYLGEKLY